MESITNNSRKRGQACPLVTTATTAPKPKRRRMATIGDAILLLNDIGMLCYQEGKIIEANTLFRESLLFIHDDESGSTVSVANHDIARRSPSVVVLPSVQPPPQQQQSPERQQLSGNGEEASEPLNGENKRTGTATRSLYPTTTPTSNTCIMKGSEYDEGMHVYRTPLSIQDSRCTHTLVATLLYNNGVSLVEMKDFEGAKQSFLRALEVIRPESCTSSSSSDGDLCLLKIQHNLGYICYRLGRRQEAMNFYLQSMFQVRGGKYDLAVACNCIAMLHLRESHCNSVDYCRELLRFSYNLFCNTVGPTSKEAATVLFNTGQAHFHRGEYNQALSSFQGALKIRELKDQDLKCDGDGEQLQDSINVAICIFGIGQSHYKLGRLERAMQCFTRFLEIRNLHGSAMDYRDVITVLNSIAILHKEKGETDKAYTVFEKALLVGKAAFGNGPHHHFMAPTLVSFGGLCFEMGKFETALELYEESLKAQEQQQRQVVGGGGQQMPRHRPEIINTLLNIAQLHWHVGRFRSAWITFKDILSLQVKSVGPTSLPVASTVSSMALIYCQMEQYDDALELYQEALRIRRECFVDQEHADITATLNTIGLVLCKLHEFKLARETFQECLKTRIKTLGEDHLDVSMLMHNLAAVHLDLNEEDDAIVLLNRALQIRREKLGPAHSEVASTLHHLGQAHQLRGTLDEAADCFRQGLAIERSKGSKKSDKVVIRRLLNLIGNIHLMRAQIPEMMECFQEACRVEREHQQQQQQQRSGVATADFGASLLITGHNFFDLARLHPHCAPVA